jgi:hypothetical protein
MKELYNWRFHQNVLRGNKWFAYHVDDRDVYMNGGEPKHQILEDTDIINLTARVAYYEKVDKKSNPKGGS